MRFERGLRRQRWAVRTICLCLSWLMVAFGLFMLAFAIMENDWSPESLILISISLIPGILMLLCMKFLIGKKELERFRESVSIYGDYDEIMAHVDQLKRYPVWGDLRFDESLLAYRNNQLATVLPASLIRGGFTSIMDLDKNGKPVGVRTSTVYLGIQGWEGDLEIPTSSVKKARALLMELSRCFPEMKVLD